MNKYFKRDEFKCSCGCKQDTVDYELLSVLTRLREFFNRSLIVTSGNRCVTYNESIGGAKGSYHLTSKAADFIIVGIEPSVVQAKLEEWYPDKYGIGSSSDFTHLDVRFVKARWSY